MKEIGRLITAMVTPFDEKGNLDYKQARKLAKALIDSGSDGLVLAGTTGESPTLTNEEKVELFAEVKDEVGKKASIIAAVGNNDTADTVYLARESVGTGVDAFQRRTKGHIVHEVSIDQIDVSQYVLDIGDRNRWSGEYSRMLTLFHESPRQIPSDESGTSQNKIFAHLIDLKYSNCIVSCSFLPDRCAI